ncbi:uncharacterized protein YegP (UPF0339 family)/MinD-like ATPase involved in chromosome partitioning or flagellar assembly [Mycolicibacterium lutetiense]|uniref:Uncharacterized protein YegP (UPF0339 family)/MinD-like ATPase involved in chromosome partitioning or flagellar assembly n=1 Tax=Mycolicibacterium lutetiense TaxID=1641992 RepID=A0ABS4ZT20_9MYCO|nr:DUF1508 domain-containing protein [Mycolicibacterium lutetiense]MBP2452667.1 uncharacterized protein YegP (UPF0339 family)/MinD-like ATPase involved in chromosome partitioning or flagellar assembly [Mycolicibacterium lutetiense]
MANTAILAARLGMSVMMVDLDLEAPGLPYKFPNQPRAKHGVLDWLTAEEPPTVNDIATQLDVPRPFRPGGSLHMVAAGPPPSIDYLHGMRSLQKGALADDSSVAVHMLVSLCDAIRDRWAPDLLLLDARTGVTTTNFITTRVLADDVVALTLNNPEQLEGTRAVLQSLVPLSKPGDDTPLGLSVIVSRVSGRAANIGSYEWSDDELATVESVRDYLTEPASPLSLTLNDPQVLLLHNDERVAARETLLMAGNTSLQSTALHVDYLRTAVALFGADLDDRISAAIAEADDQDSAGARASFFARAGHTGAVKPDPAQRISADDTDNLSLTDQVTLLRSLALNDPARTHDLAEALIALAETQRALGDRSAAVESAREASTLLSRLADTDTEKFASDASRSLVTLSTFLAECGDVNEALASAQAAYERTQSIAITGPTADRARALTILTARYAEKGDDQAAFQAARDAAEMWRSLTAGSEAQPELGHALSDLATQAAQVGDYGGATHAAEEAVAIFRSLTADYPHRYLSDLGHSLAGLAASYSDVGALQPAHDAAADAADLFRSLAQAEPEKYLDDLAQTLGNLATRSADLGLYESAITSAEEAVSIFRRLGVMDPDRYRPDLAALLASLSRWTGQAGNKDETVRYGHEAVDLYRSLAANEPTRYSAALASALTDLSIAEPSATDAIDLAQQAIRLYEPLTVAQPYVYSSILGRAKENLARRYARDNRTDAAIENVRDAIRLYHETADIDEWRRIERLAQALHELSGFLAMSATQLTVAGRDPEAHARRQEALTTASQSASFYRQLGNTNSERYLPALASVLSDIADLQALLGDGAKAQSADSEAHSIHNQLIHAKPPRRASGTATRISRFEIFREVGGGYSFRLKDANGQIILTGTPQPTIAGARNGIREIRDIASEPAEIMDVTEGGTT